MSFLSGTARSARLFAFVSLLSCLALFWPGLAQAAHTSNLCTPLTAHVPSGGSVAIDVTACAGNIFLASDGAVDGPALPQRGSAVLRVDEPRWYVDYSHNGVDLQGDVFEFTDTANRTVRVTMIIDPPASAIVVSPATLGPMTAGTAFSQTFTATGGTAPYAYTISSGQVPPGLILGSTGILSGTPTRRGPFSFSVRATDNLGGVVDKAYSVTVQNPSLTLSPTAATATLNAPFTLLLDTSGGVAPYNYALESGGLAPGITLTNQGYISGTPTGPAQTYTFTLRVTDGSTGTAPYFELKTFALTVGNAPTVSIAVSPASVNEDSGQPLVYTVARSVTQATPLVVNLGTSGTATSGSDYTGGVSTVTIPANAISATVNIVPVNDTAVEADETVILTVLPGTGYTVGAPASATGTILNDDKPVATIAVAPAIVDEDSGTPMIYTVTLDRTNPIALSVPILLGGTGVFGVDYTGTPASVTIPAGQTTGTLSLTPIANTTAEPNRTVVVSLQSGTGFTLGTPASATGTIRDDDLPALHISDVAQNEGDSGTSAFTFTVSLDVPAGPGGVTFDIATADGTATAGSDYVARSLVGQSIPAGAQNYTFTVQVNGDTMYEANETFLVNVSNVARATIVDGQGVGTIINDDALPTLSIVDYMTTEGDSGTTRVDLTVSLSAASGVNVTVQYATADGTAIAPADYTAVSGVVTFPPGVTTQTITVLVNGDTTVEADETFQVRLTNPANATLARGTATVTILNDDAPMTLSPPSLPAPRAGAVYNQPLTVTGGVAPYTFTHTGNLPPGVSLNAAGVVSGTPTAVGTYAFTVTATDNSAVANTQMQAYVLAVLQPLVVLPGAPLPPAVLGQPFNSNRGPATGGTEPYIFSAIPGTLPPGLSLSPAGVLSGTPTAAGTYSFTVAVRDGTTGTGAPYGTSETLTLTVVDPVPVAGNVPLTTSYDAPATPVALVLSGGAATSVAVATAPQHGTATVTGPLTISYQPTSGYAGPDSFTYTATGPGGTSAPATVTVTVGIPVITVSASGGFAAVAGTPYSQTFTWAGGAQPYTAHLVSNLPAGLTVTATTATTVTISGTPTASGSFGLVASARDSSTGTGPFTTGMSFVLTVASPTLSATPATLPAGTAGSAYQQAITASGGVAPYQVTLSGTLPTGMSFNAATGMLSGTPTQSGTFALSATLTDSTTGTPASVTQAYSLVVASPTLSATPATLPAATAGTAYQQAFTATGGIAPYQVTLSGTLPTGMSFDAATGTLSGTPTQSGTFALSAMLTDSTTGTPASVTQPYSLVVASPALSATPATLPAGTAGSAYQQAISATGGIAPYQVALSGTLPTGVAFDAATGTLSGTPLQSGTFALTATITDSTGGTPASVTQPYSLVVASPVLVTPLSALPGGTAGSVYQQAFTATGGIAPYHVALSGALPAGLSFDAGTGTLSGTPTQSGTFALTVTITDSTAGTPARLTQPYSLVVASPVLAATPATLAAAAAGTPYQQVFSATGGIAPYRVLLSGTLPAGLSFDAGTGTLSGTPTQSGTFALAATVTDSTGGTPASLVQAYTLTVAAPALSLSPVAGALPASTAGSSYTLGFTTEGGLAPYRYALTAGALPAGLVLDVATGRIAGTPGMAGSFAFSVTVTDATTGGAGTLTQAYSLSVAAPVLALTPTSLPAGLFANRYEQVLTATGGTAPYRYAVSAGALPDGMTLEAAGMLAGTPTAAGAFAFTVTATDALGFTGSHDYVVQIAQRPDPTRDPEVRGLLTAQRDAARRFANSQIENFQQRMQRLHGASRRNGFSNNLSLSYATRRCEPMVGNLPGPDCDAQRRQPFDRETGPEQNAPSAVGTASQAPLGLWVGGTIRSGRSEGGQRAGTDFETDGVTVGSDLRISEAFAVGAGLGYGRDRSDVGESGSRSDGQAYSMAVYASYSPGRSLFVDALLGHQLLDYTLRRYVTGDGGFVHARRNGSQWFGSLAFGADLAKGNWQFTPYARLDASQGSLDRYVEQGNDLFALRYGEQDVDATTGNAGLRVEMRNTAGWGAWTPQLRVEYQHDFSGSGLATLQYADLVDVPLYRTTLDGFDRSRWMLGAGVMFDFGRTWGLRVDYRGLVGSGNDRDHGVQISLDKEL